MAIIRRICWLICGCALLATLQAADAEVVATAPTAVVVTAGTAASTGMQTGVSFTQYSLLSSSAELMRRLTSPLQARHLHGEMHRLGSSIREQPIDLAREKFALYVPPEVPARGYALLVFVPPWKEAAVPRGWASLLDHAGMIYVSAAESGNDANVLDRREPLALLAAQNVVLNYKVDPSRVYISGFSGGSRVALRIALGYPDMFRGALLIAGSDPIGNAESALPPADLFSRFQESTRLVFLTGRKDEFNLHQAAASAESLREWCVFDQESEVMAWAGHEVPDAQDLKYALDALSASVEPDPRKLADCRARLEGSMTAALTRVKGLIAAGQLKEASKQLVKIDTHYGGMAAPRSVELAEQIEAAK